jgi:trimeric autotransporter adhesin
VGNVYISDSTNHRVRKVDVFGTISTVAGNGIAAHSADGGAATMASLNSLNGVAVDAAGNLYIADYGRIRKVDGSGTISTVAGNGSLGYSGDGGPATAASLSLPSGLAFDAAGNLYIADRTNNRIRKVDTSGTISTVAGNGIAGFSGDGGAATAASLWNPWDVFVDAAGNLYIADGNNQRIRKVDTAGMISTVAGTGGAIYSGDGGPATAAGLSNPHSVIVDGAGNLYIVDRSNYRIRKVDGSGIITTVVGSGTQSFSGDGGAATAAGLNNPFGAALDSDGNLYITDGGHNRVRKVRSFGETE